MSVATAPVGACSPLRRQTGDRSGRRELGRVAARGPFRRPPSPGSPSTCGFCPASATAQRRASSSTISSEELAQSAGVNSAKLRKDLSFLGSYGIRGVGYDVGTLTEEISRTLGAHRAHRVALVGTGQSRSGAGRLPRLRRSRLRHLRAVRRRPAAGSAGRSSGVRIEHIRDADRGLPGRRRHHRRHRRPRPSAAQEVADVLVAPASGRS